MITNKQREIVTKRSKTAVERLMLKHIDRFNNLLYGIQISPDLFSFKNAKIRGKVGNLTKLLEEEVYNLIVYYASANMDGKEDKKDILAYINRDRDGKYLKEIISNHIKTLNSEIEAYIEMALFFSIAIPTSLSILKRDIKNPYNTELIKKGYKDIKKPNNNILKSKGNTVKVGNYKTSLANIKRMAGFIVIEAITNRMVNKFMLDGFVKIGVRRGSSYPCDLCDSMVGVYPIDSFPMPPFHGGCYCNVYVVPNIKKYGNSNN